MKNEKNKDCLPRSSWGEVWTGRLINIPRKHRERSNHGSDPDIGVARHALSTYVRRSNRGP